MSLRRSRMPDMTKWTPEQITNAMTYGICAICGAPRKSETVTVYTSGSKSANIETRMVCENGHAGW